MKIKIGDRLSLPGESLFQRIALTAALSATHSMGAVSVLDVGASSDDGEAFLLSVSELSTSDGGFVFFTGVVGRLIVKNFSSTGVDSGGVLGAGSSSPVNGFDGLFLVDEGSPVDSAVWGINYVRLASDGQDKWDLIAEINIGGSAANPTAEFTRVAYDPEKNVSDPIQLSDVSVFVEEDLVVPEPSSAFLSLLGGLALTARRRR